MKRRNFTLSIKNQIDDFIKLVEQFPQWAWIIHDKDIDPETNQLIEKHIHAYLECPNPRSFKSISESLNVPENMVCKVIDKNGILQYLIHKNQPDKFQYDYTEIHSNFDLEPFFMNKSNTLWYDFMKLKSQQISPQEFYDIHKNEIESNSIYQKLKIFDMISSFNNPPESPYPYVRTVVK